MYEELINRLTACEDDCSRCQMMYDEQVEQDLVREHCAAYEAADAIERLADENTRLVTTANELSKMYDKLVDEMPDGWIPVTERLPRYGDWVLGIGPKKGYHVCEYRGITHFPYSGDIPWFSAKGRYLTITHWMPLQEPPKEETE